MSAWLKTRRTRIRLRTKFLLSLLLVTLALTCATLLIVRHSVQAEIRNEIFGRLHDSVVTFRTVQRQREMTLTRSAELLANIPTLKALMTTRDAITIQDGSGDLWRLAGSELFLLSDKAGRVVALHTATPGITRGTAQELLKASLGDDEARHWWYERGHLYEVFLQPIYFGPATENRLLGVLAVGYEIDHRVAHEVSRVSASEVAFRYGDSIVASTLSPLQETELLRQTQNGSSRELTKSDEIQLGTERFIRTSVDLAPGSTTPVRLSVLKSYDQATLFLTSLNNLLLGIGLLAVLAGAALVYFISLTFTRPLDNLVAGVRALEKGDFSFPLAARGGDEVAEVTGAFDRMRGSLQRTNQQLLDSERQAVVGRMAASISHDLRHPLAAVLANAEFLAESRLEAHQRADLYHEIGVAVNQMTDLIDSLLEFTRTRESLRPVQGSLEKTAAHAIHAVRAHPEFHRINITLSCEGRGVTRFDPKKLERVFYNLLLNACETVQPETGRVEVSIREAPNQIEIRIGDNGLGIPEPVRAKLFQPFVSFGKEKGIGLGLATVQKILQDHGGDVAVESSSEAGTVFKLVLPLTVSSHPDTSGQTTGTPLMPIVRSESGQ
ncbi:MAG TPA: HAMP domain-containing sensor histidine kinase [Candidatus Dormibacteraeota bacterium]|nr:HAMP domain-containing sensor histidine kinase [Candidatus Dormibacteraeota bacterium]